MKQNIAIVLLLATLSFTYAQTNTFPTTGNVGIGTEVPIAKLEVLGDFKPSKYSLLSFQSSGLHFKYIKVSTFELINKTKKIQKNINYSK